MIARLLVCLAMFATVSCAASQRESAIKAALVTADATSAAFVAYDSSRQDEIAAAATSLEDGKAKLAEYRGKRAKAEKAFAVAYRAIAVAATLNDDQSIAALQTAVADVVAAVKELTGGAK